MSIFPLSFLNFRFDAGEKQNIINFSSYGCESYASVDLSDSEVMFLWDREDTAFCLFLYCVLFIDSIASTKKYVIKFSCHPCFRKYFIKARSFSAYLFFSTVSSSSSVNYPSLMSNLLLIIFISDFRKVSEQIFEMFFPLLSSFFFAGSFYFYSQGAVPSNHFIYCLPCFL